MMFLDSRLDFLRREILICAVWRGFLGRNEMPASKKFDIYKESAADYVTPKDPVILNIKPAQYLAIAGRGEPGGKTFQSTIGALYNVAFTVKMARKFAGRDYTVSKLEGLWWIDDSARSFLDSPPESWNWKLMIRVPAFITEKEVAASIEKLLGKNKPKEVASVKLEKLTEGKCVQVLHLGPYDKERPTIERMHAHAESNGLKFHGLHHEIYLSDPRRVAPAKLRTILRNPVE
jgi:hypothetical protein